MFIDIYVRYIQMHLFYISSIVYTEEENIYVYIFQVKKVYRGERRTSFRIKDYND